MTVPGIVHGGRFFSDTPGSTPKGARNKGPLRSERVNSMARLFIDVPTDKMEALLSSLPADTAEAAKTLLFAGDITQAAARGAGYLDFLLTSAQHPFQEREQAIDTLTDNTVIYYSGESAPVFSYSGWLFNTYQDDQNVWFHLLYHDFLMSGYVSNFQTAISGDIKNGVQFSFSFRAKRVQIATPILFNPSIANSDFSSNLFERNTAVDNSTRHGVETSELPASPRGVPAASATRNDADARSVEATQGVPPREQQARIDTAIVQQGTAANAQLPTPELRQAVDAAAAPILSASGDVRASLSAAEASRFQDFSVAAPSPEESSSEPLVQLELEIERRLRAADPRGTSVVSPVTGAVEVSGSYADTIARAGITSVPEPSTPTPAPLDSEDDALLDVRNPPPHLLEELSRARQNAAPPALRSRQRPTG
jgi:hypothetical protein